MIVPVNQPVATAGGAAAIDAAGNFSSTTLIHAANWAIVRLVGSTVGQNTIWTLASDNGLPLDFANGPLASMGQVLIAPGQRPTLTINAATTFAGVSAQFVGLMSESLEELLPHYTPSPNPLGATVRGAVSVVGGEGNFTDVIITGLTGAANQYRLVGSTLGGPPITGTFGVGDFVIDRQWGITWVCTVSGTPGTWQPSGPATVALVTTGFPLASIRLPAAGSFPAYFTELMIDGEFTTDQAAVQSLGWRMNGDAVGPYEWFTGLSGGSPAALSAAGNVSDTSLIAGYAAVRVGGFAFRIPNYPNAARPKVMTGTAHRFDAIAANDGLAFGGGVWNPAAQAAVTSLTVFPAAGNLAAGYVRVRAQ